MAKTFAMLTCDSVNIDASSGKHFIFGHFSSIKVNNFPATHPNLTLFVGITDVPAGDHSLELRFGLPSNTPPPPPPQKKFPWDPPPPPPPPDPMNLILTQKLTSTGNSERLYLITELKDLYFEKEGNYQLAIALDKAALGDISLNVKK